jgi:ABC-type uncharacterized transport system YnjBCD substrate-binding protein
MKPLHTVVIAGAAALALGLGGTARRAETTLNVVTAGSQNMVDYITDYLGPLFEKANPGVKVRVTGTGPGDAGSQKIFEKLDAQKKAGTAAWDVDVAVVHQKKAGEMVSAGLLATYRGDIETGGMVTRDTAKRALGVDVEGYVMPMFHSQTALAYHPDLVSDPPGSYDELIAWVKQHPKAFGYNGIKNGMSGVSFVVGWMYAYTGQGDRLMNGPYDPALKAGWDKQLADLKAFNQYITLTPGNAGTLDMLNRGEIVMGPVWVDMFYTWQADGRVPPNMKLKLIGPHRAGHQPAGAGRGHRQALQLVSGHRRRARAEQAGAGGLGKAVQRRDAAGPGQQGQGVPDRSVLRRHQGGVREAGRELIGAAVGARRSRREYRRDACGENHRRAGQSQLALIG